MRPISIISALVVFSLLLVLSPAPASAQCFDDEKEQLRIKICDDISFLLDQINYDLGGDDARVAQAKMKLSLLLALSLDRDEYNRKAASGRAFRETADFDYDAYYDSISSLSNNRLKKKLHLLVDNHYSLSYRDARLELFLRLDNFDGTIECVYTGEKRECHNALPNPSIMNTEHTWPQSLGAVGVARTDLHHLFITNSKANSIRGSLPFGWVTDPDWAVGGSCRGNGCFQPRPCHRGNVARAIFYFAVRYNKRVPPREEAALRQWHHDDPVDQAERDRNDKVFKVQRNRNPFVDRPQFVDQIADF